MKLTMKTAAALACLAAAIPASAVTNGSFDDLDASYVNEPGWDLQSDAAATGWSKFQSPDWMLSGGPQDLYASPDPDLFALGAATGAFDTGVYREGIFQTVTGLTPGQEYAIGFRHANDNSTASDFFTADWQTNSVNFTATAASHEIRFVAYKPDSPLQDPTFQFLDSVTLSVVPEPSALAIVGVAGLLTLRRRP